MRSTNLPLELAHEIGRMSALTNSLLVLAGLTKPPRDGHPALRQPALSTIWRALEHRGATAKLDSRRRLRLIFLICRFPRTLRLILDNCS